MLTCIYMYMQQHDMAYSFELNGGVGCSSPMLPNWFNRFSRIWNVFSVTLTQ